MPIQTVASEIPAAGATFRRATGMRVLGACLLALSCCLALAITPAWAGGPQAPIRFYDRQGKYIGQIDAAGRLQDAQGRIQGRVEGSARGQGGTATPPPRR